MGRGLLGESRRSISFQTRPPPGQLLGEEFFEYSNIYTNIFVVFRNPDIPSIPNIPGRVWFAFSPLPDHVHYLPSHVYHLPDHVHHISHINTNILSGICWYPWYQIYLDVRSLFFYTNILLLAEIFTYVILCLGAHFPFESRHSGGEGAQCRKWLGCPEESMRGVTLTGAFPH